jgi:hypothetical protein
MTDSHTTSTCPVNYSVSAKGAFTVAIFFATVTSDRGQVSISPTFNEKVLHQNPFAKKLQTQIVNT